MAKIELNLRNSGFDQLMKIFALFLTMVLALTSTSAPAWGPTGHRVIGELAGDRINGRTAEQMALILGVEDAAEASTWADDQRSNPLPFWRYEAGPWHYVTVPDGRTYAEVGPPPQGDAVSVLADFTAIVRDENASREERARALRFIIHIVGDLHQPLHVGNGTDRGGNDFDVTWFGQSSNLHRVWDSQMIDGRQLSYSEYEAWLDRAITPQQEIEWWTPDPLIWVEESAVIRRGIYPHESQTALGYGYAYWHRRTAERRLQQGGIRLAAYLDWLFAE